MHTVVVKPVNSQFVVVWVKLMMRAGHQLSELDPILDGKNLIINNTAMIDSMKRDFRSFRQSGLSMDQHFGHNIIIAKRQHGSKFNVDRNIRLSYDKVILMIMT